MALASRAISIALLSAVVYFLAYRSGILWTFYANTPGRLSRISNIVYEIKFKEIIRNCEDAVLDEKNSVAILSCDPGRDKWNTVMGTFINANDVRDTLWSYEYSDPSAVPQPLELKNLPASLLKTIHPLGIALWAPTRTLYVISHQHPHSLLVFTLSPDGTSATYQRQIIHPLLRTPNSVTPISDHEVYFTNDHLFKAAENPLLAKLESYLAYPGGSVVYFDLSTNTGKKVASVPFANGIALLKDGKRIAVGSTTLPAVLVYNFDASTHELTLNKTLKMSFLVDNLKVDTTGMLLVAGHPWAPGVEEVATKNWQFDLDGTGEGKPESERPTAGSWVVEWDGNEDTCRTLYVGMDYGTSTTAVRDVKKGVGIVTGLYEMGIMVWREK